LTCLALFINDLSVKDSNFTVLGPSALVGMGLLVCLFPFSASLAQCMTRFRRKKLKLSDERVKTISQFLNGIVVVKMFGWELKFWVREY